MNNLLLQLSIVVILFDCCANCYHFSETIYATPLTSSIVKIINDFYVEQTASISLSRYSINRYNQYIQSDNINEILYQTRTRIVIRFEAEFIQRFYGSQQPRYYNLIFIDGYQSFR